MSGETLRAPRQQLRRLRASAFVFALDFQQLLKSTTIARLSGASFFGFSRGSLWEGYSRILTSKSFPIPKNRYVIRKPGSRQQCIWDFRSGALAAVL